MAAPVTGRRGALVLALILALGLALRGLDLFDPWCDSGFKSAFGGRATGSFARNFLEHGFLEARLMPYQWRVELEDGTVERQWYVHHPAAFAVVTALSMRALADDEWAARLPWLAVSLLFLVAAWRLLHELWGRRVAAWGTLVLAVVPLAAHYGSMLWTDQAVLALFALLLRRYALWMRDGSARHLAAGGGYALLGGMLDWTMHIALVGLASHAVPLAVARLRRGAPARSLAPLVLPAAGGAAAVLVHYAHMRLVLSAEEIAAETSGTLGGVTSLVQRLPAFLAAQAEHISALVTLPLLAVLAFGLVRQVADALRGRMGREEALLLAMLVPGPLYVALFPGRSTNHGFFWGLGLLWVGATGGLVLARATDAWRRPAVRWGRAAALVLAAAALAPAAARDVERWRAQRCDRIVRLAEAEWLAPVLDDPRAVVLASAGQGLLLSFYSRAPVLGPFVHFAELERTRERLLARLGPDRRVVFLFSGAAYPFARPLHERLSAVAPSERRAVEVEGEPGLHLEVFDLSAWAAGP